MKRYRALFVTSAVPEAAAAMRGWLSAGHEIAQLWRPLLPRQGSLNRDRRLAYLAPRWSTTALAGRHGIPVRTVPRLSTWDDSAQAARDAGADVLISIYFPFVVPGSILDIFGRQAVNLHPAPLPRYRGPTPVYAMLADGSLETEGAMTLHVMAQGLDTGDIVGRSHVSLRKNRCPMRYSLDLARAGERLVAETLPAYLDGTIEARLQDETSASYCRTTAGELALGSHLDADAIRLRCDFLGKRRGVAIEDLPDVTAIAFGGIVGPRTGAPPRAGRFSVEMDAADMRVRLRRKQPWSSPWNKARSLAIMAVDQGR